MLLDICSRRTFIQSVQRPFQNRHRIKNGLPEIWAAQRVQARVCRSPNDVAVPLDKNVVDRAVVASEYFQIAALRRNEVSDFFGFIKISNVVAAEPGDEIRISNKFLPRFTGGLQVRWIVRAETPALEA